MNSFKIRLTTWDKELINLFVDYITSSGGNYIYCKEHVNGSNFHTHWYIETHYVEHTIRQFIRSSLKLKGGPGYNCHPCDYRPLEYIRYMFSNPQEEGIQSNYLTLEERTYYQEEENKFKSSLVVQKEAKKKKSSSSVLSLMRDELLSKFTLGEVIKGRQTYLYLDEEGYKTSPTVDFILDYVVEYYRLNRVQVRKFQMLSQVQTLCFEFVNSYDQDFKKQLREDLYR